MELRSRNARTFHRSRPVVPCAQCGDTLFAPEWSEYLDDRRIRHLWSCDACGYEFETEVCYPPRRRAGGVASSDSMPQSLAVRLAAGRETNHAAGRPMKSEGSVR